MTKLCADKMAIFVSERQTKHCGNKEKMLISHYQHYPPLSIMFSKVQINPFPYNDTF